jgi:hypothetical protein
MNTLNDILTKNLIVYSNIDEVTLRKAQEWEQEETHRNFNYGIETDPPEQDGIAKTLMSGSKWMR